MFPILNMKHIFIALIVLALVLSGCPAQPSNGNGNGTTPETKEFNITAKQFEFSPSTITVNKGDTVIVNITSQDVQHGFALPDFGVNETVDAGQTTRIEFVADKSGEFTFFCSVFCGSGHSTMKGKLVVNG